MFLAAGFDDLRDARERHGRAENPSSSSSCKRAGTARCCRTRWRCCTGIAIVFASLQPFSPWILPEPDTPFWPFAPWPLALHPLRHPRQRGRLRALRRLRRAVAAARDAARAHGHRVRLRTHAVVRARDAADVPAAARREPRRPRGQCRGRRCSAAWPARRSFARTAPREALSAARHRIFLPGKLGDFGLALLVLWLVAQINPGHPALRRDLRRRARAPGAAPLARPPRPIPRSCSSRPPSRRSSCSASACSSRCCCASGASSAAPSCCCWSPPWSPRAARPRAHAEARGVGELAQARRVVRHDRGTRWSCCSSCSCRGPCRSRRCAIALLASLLLPVLGVDLPSPRAPLTLFNWRYGHLLNFNGLTQSVLLAWPIAGRGVALRAGRAARAGASRT